MNRIITIWLSSKASKHEPSFLHQQQNQTELQSNERLLSSATTMLQIHFHRAEQLNSAEQIQS